MADRGTKTSADLGYEARDANVKAVAVFGVALFVITAVCFGIAAGVFAFFATTSAKNQPALTPMSTLQKPELPADPRLLTSEPTSLAALREAERERLDTYGWVDRGAGIVHVPLERAMELVAQEGLPAAQRR